MARDNKSSSVFWVLLSNYTVIPLNFVYQVLSKRILGELAVKLTSHSVYIGSFVRYFDFLLFPFISSLSREIPLNSKINEEYAKKVSDVVFTISLLISFLALVIFLILGYYAEDLILRLLFYVTGVTSISKFIRRYINVYLSSHGKFIKKAKLGLLASYIRVPICLLLIYYLGDYGYVLAILVTAISSALPFFILMNWAEVSIRFDLGILKNLLKKSLPFTLYLGVETILFSLDKLLIRGISINELGLYGFAFQIAFMVYETPKNIYSTLFPYLISDLKDKNFLMVKTQVELIQKRIQIFVVFIIIFTFSIFILLIDIFLPQFDGSQKYASVLFIIPYVFSFNYIYYVYCMAKRYDKLIIKASLISIISAILVFTFIFFFLESPFVVSLSIVAVLFLNSILLILGVYKKYSVGTKALRFVFKDLFLFIMPYLVHVFLLMGNIFHNINTFLSVVLSTIISLTILIVLIYIRDPALPSYIKIKVRNILRR